MEKLSEILKHSGIELLEPVASVGTSLLVLTVSDFLSSHVYFLKGFGLDFVGCRPHVDSEFPHGCCLWVTILINCDDLVNDYVE